jgi:hypothetical protein
MTDQETADEIAQIERELEILRSRQALVARWDRIANVYCVIGFVISPPFFAILVYVWTSDLFMAAFIIVMTLVVAILIWIIGTRTIDRPSSVATDRRQPSLFLPIGASIGPFRGLGFSFGSGPNYKSDEETIQDMIVLRQHRLAELKGEPFVPSVPSVSGLGRTREAKRGRSKI